MDKEQNINSIQELEQLKKNNTDWKDYVSLSNKEEFSKMLYSITHKEYPEEEAQKLWFNILDHNKTLTILLERDPGLLVSALDYLWNFTKTMDSPYLTEESEINNLREKALKDNLTGLATREVFNVCMDKEIANSRRYKNPLSLAMIDVDHFKKINDEHGHLKGDEVLKALALFLKTQMRESDLPIRYGGEEFIIVLRETGGEMAHETMIRLCKKIEAAKLGGLPVTVSIGVSAFDPETHKSKDCFIDCSDKAMYEAKQKGRNRVIFK